MQRTGQPTDFFSRAALVFALTLLLGNLSAQMVDEDSVSVMIDEAVADSAETFVMPDTADYDAADVGYDGVSRTPSKRWFLENEGQPVKYGHRRLKPQQRSSMKADEDYWYADYDFSEKRKETRDDGWDPGFLRSPLFRTILWILIIGGFAAVLIIYLSNNNISLFRSSGKIDDTDPADPAMEDIFGIDYQREIGLASGAGNYRLAVRLLFLQLLRQLTDNGIITYAHDRTNMDYLMQLASGAYYKPFFNLARAYEYAWYGQFPVDQHQYEAIRSEFDQFSKNLHGR